MSETTNNLKNKPKKNRGVMVFLILLGVFILSLIIVNVVDSQPKIRTETETKTEIIHYNETTVEDSSMAKGTTEVRTSGVNGEKTVTHEVKFEKKNNKEKEISREVIKEEVVKQPTTEIKAVGTYVAPPPPSYTGYCSVEGTYRNRYARCYGNYSPTAQSQAQAYQCNSNSRAIQGCYNTYR